MTAIPTTTTTNGPAANEMTPPARAVRVEPYLSFDGRCEEAIEFYRQAVGAEVAMLMRFKDSPGSDTAAPVDGNKVMHASLRIGDSMIMASDGCSEGGGGFQGFSLSLSLPDAPQAERVFAALAKGGKVQQPLISTFFASRFGIVADRFGVSWMIVVQP